MTQPIQVGSHDEEQHAYDWMFKEASLFSDEYENNLTKLGEDYANKCLPDSVVIPDWVWESAFNVLEDLDMLW